MDDSLQNLNVSLHDGGGGFYYVIKTERWAFDSIESLVALLDRIKKVMN